MSRGRGGYSQLRRDQRDAIDLPEKHDEDGQDDSVKENENGHDAPLSFCHRVPCSRSGLEPVPQE